jgi:hypothetical protein
VTNHLFVCAQEWNDAHGPVLFAGRPACDGLVPPNGSVESCAWSKRSGQAT